LWNAHRIHFDETYTTEVEGYPGLVIAGPMIGDWLHQCVEDWLGEEGRLVSMEYSNRIAAYIGETLHYGGNVIALDSDSQEARVEVFIKNEAGKIVAPGEATVLFANKE
jgi:3-methylfumaryl-CoA hydratase